MSKSFPITIFGVEYPSLKRAAADFDFPESTFRKYLSVYYVEPEPLVACLGGLIRLAYIGLDGKAYYIIPDPKLSGCYTAREIVEHYRPDLLDAYDADNPTGKYKPYNYPN